MPWLALCALVLEMSFVQIFMLPLQMHATTTQYERTGHSQIKLDNHDSECMSDQRYHGPQHSTVLMRLGLTQALCTPQCAGTLGMQCTFMPLPHDSVIEVTSDAATPSGPPICVACKHYFIQV